MPQIEIFDIDGTLTHVFGDMPDKTGHPTYAFWPLITHHFTKDSVILQKMIDEWDESMKTETDPTGSSHNMMQKGIETFKDHVTGEDVRKFAKQVTLDFIRAGAVRKEAIAFLEQRVKQGVTCILSTGSYQDGALGFVDALAEAGLISKETQKALRVSGAIVDWDDYLLLHANVRERKPLGIEKVMGKKLSELQPLVRAAYGDDPWINDKAMLEMAPPGKGYVILTGKNKDKDLPEGYVFSTWEQIISSQVQKEVAESKPVSPPMFPVLSRL